MFNKRCSDFITSSSRNTEKENDVYAWASKKL